MMRGFRARDVVGRTIVACDLHRQWDERRREWYHNAEFTLDNGTRLRFVVEETDTGDYGIYPVVRKPKR